jgi:hypothetical protein
MAHFELPQPALPRCRLGLEETAVWWHLIYAGPDRFNISERPASCSAWAVLKERHVAALGAELTSPWRPSTAGWKRFAELVQLAKARKAHGILIRLEMLSNLQRPKP